MGRFASPDGTEVAYRTLGRGNPLGGGRLLVQFPHGQVAVQPGAGHFPWLDDAAWFRAAITAFLG